MKIECLITAYVISSLSLWFKHSVNTMIMHSNLDIILVEEATTMLLLRNSSSTVNNLNMVSSNNNRTMVRIFD